jgi:hypothetical protein
MGIDDFICSSLNSLEKLQKRCTHQLINACHCQGLREMSLASITYAYKLKLDSHITRSQSIDNTLAV